MVLDLCSGLQYSSFLPAGRGCQHKTRASFRKHLISRHRYSRDSFHAKRRKSGVVADSSSKVACLVGVLICSRLSHACSGCDTCCLIQLNVLVVGGGGREHALAWKLTSSDRCETLFCSPGNAGIAMEHGVKVEADLNINDHQEVLQASISPDVA